MPSTLTIRFESDEDYERGVQAAAALGMKFEPWARQLLNQAAMQPTIKQSYKLRAIGPNDANAVIGRYKTGLNAQGAANLSQAQYDAYKQAKLLIERNGAGDRERAISLLQAQFADVFETAG